MPTITTQKTIRIIVVFFLLSGILLFSLGPRLAIAQTPPPPPGDPVTALEKKLPAGACGSVTNPLGLISGECLAYIVAWLGFIVLEVAGVVLQITNFVFNASLGVAINNVNYTVDTIPALGIGWTFTRDVVNLFFIFILLFIAIATIFQIESYGAKALLARLIIIALLVNFSMLAAQSIIFLSNALTVEFYNAVEVDPSDFWPNFSTVLDFSFNKDLGLAIVNAFSPQALLANLPSSLTVGDTLTVLLALIEVTAIGIVLILSASFVLLVGAFFFIVRLVVLWLLIILAPFGFLFLILPLTRGYAQTWWRKLMEQAFFAPTFMFLLVLVIIMIQTGFSSFLGTAEDIQAMEIPEFLFLLFLQGTLMVILLVACLWISRQMGVYGAAAAIGWAGSAGKWGRAKVLAVPRRLAARPAEWIAGRAPEGRVGRALQTGLQYIPGVALGAAAIASRQRARVGELQKSYEKYSDLELKNLISRGQPMNRVAIMQELTKRGELAEEGGLTTASMRQATGWMRRYGISPRPMFRLRPDLAATPEELGELGGILRTPTAARTHAQNLRMEAVLAPMRDAARRIRPTDVENMDVSLARIPEAMRAIAEGASPAVIQGLVQRGGDLFAALRAQYIELANGSDRIADIATGLENAPVNNRAAGAWLRSSPGGGDLLGLRR